MSTYPCSVCQLRGEFTMLEEPVIEEKPSCMQHIHIPSFFSRCGHHGYFRWTKKSFVKLCKRKGWTYRVEEGEDEIAV